MRTLTILITLSGMLLLTPFAIAHEDNHDACDGDIPVEDAIAIDAGGNTYYVDIENMEGSDPVLPDALTTRLYIESNGHDGLQTGANQFQGLTINGMDAGLAQFGITRDDRIMCVAGDTLLL